MSLRIIEKDQFVKKANDELDNNIPLNTVFRDNRMAQEDINEVLSNKNSLLSFFSNYRLSQLNAGTGDVIAEWLMDSNGINIIIITALSLMVGLIPAIISIFEGNFINNRLALSTFNDFGYWEQYPVAMPIVILLTTMYFRRFPITLIELVLQGVVPVSRDQWNEFVSKTAKKVYGNKFVKMPPYVIGIICALFLSKIYLFDTSEAWFTIRFSKMTTVAGWFLAINIFILYFLLSLAIIRIIATSIILRAFFDFSPNIQPLHPDGSGGLLPLGKLSKSLNLGVFLFGLVSALGIYVNHVTYHKAILSGVNIAIMSAYVFGASVVFFMPLLSAHAKMKQAKYEITQTINFHFERENRELMNSLQGTGEIDKEKISKIESLLIMHDIAVKMPIYPFNIETITSFMGSILIPIALYLLQILIINIIQPTFGP